MCAASGYWTSTKDTKKAKGEVHDAGNEENKNMQSVHTGAAASSFVYNDMIATS